MMVPCWFSTDRRAAVVIRQIGTYGSEVRQGGAMISLYFYAAFHIHSLLQRHAPTNVLVRVVRARTGPSWLPAATLLGGVGYLFATAISIHVVEQDGPGWVNLLVLVCAWNAPKLGAAGTGLSRAKLSVSTVVTPTQKIRPHWVPRLVGNLRHVTYEDERAAVWAGDVRSVVGRNPVPLLLIDAAVSCGYRCDYPVRTATNQHVAECCLAVAKPDDTGSDLLR